MKRVSMLLQLFVTLFCVLAIPTIIMTTYSGNQVLSYSEDAIAESAMASLNASRKLTEEAMLNISQDVVRLASTYKFSEMHKAANFTALNSDYENIINAQSLLQELQLIKLNTDGVHSIFFYLVDSDYVIATDIGISRLENANAVNWLEETLADRKGIYGVWHPRVMTAATNGGREGQIRYEVLSFIFPLNRLTTSTKGYIVLNLYESQVAGYINSTAGGGELDGILLDRNGVILSHRDKSLLFRKTENPYYLDILNDAEVNGYTFNDIEGERMLYTFCRSEEDGWVYISAYSMDRLMVRTNVLRRGMTALTVGIIILGAAATAFLASLLSRPARELARMVRERKTLGVMEKNELAFLDAAFKQIQQDEERLYQLLREKERDSERLLLLMMLRGETINADGQELLAKIFPEPYFMVAAVSIDSYSRYVSDVNPEARAYHRYLYLPQCEAMFPGDVHARCVYQGGGIAGLIINFNQSEYDAGRMRINSALEGAKSAAVEIMSHTVTIGASAVCERRNDLRGRLAEAAEAMKHRLIYGGDSLIYWNPEYGSGKKYVYPTDSERRILNYLSTGGTEQICEELKEIRKYITSEKSISYDNILFIYNGLVGAVNKYLSENNIDTGRVFTGLGNVYAVVASADTLDEVDEYLKTFFRDIIDFINDAPEGLNERILNYMDSHYKEDIVFEDMAAEMGISYSYMRKLVREATGNSLIDYVNILRIEEVKRLLRETGLNITQIAIEAGYHNIQSVNRYFKKYEGVTPGEYRKSYENLTTHS